MPFNMSQSTFTGNTLLHRHKLKMNVSSGINFLGRIYGKTIALVKLRFCTVHALEFG